MTELEALRGDVARLKTFARERASYAYLGDSTGLCRVLGKYKLFVDTTSYDVAPHLMLDGIWEPWSTRILARLIEPGMRVVDVGAHVGYFTVLAADLVGARGRVWAFEPNPRVFELLRRSVSANGFSDRVELWQRAVAERDHQRAKMAMRKGELGGAHLGSGVPGDEAFVTFEVHTIRLDTALDTGLSTERVDIIKIDAEGAEARIWEGMQTIAKNNRQLSVLLEFNAARLSRPRHTLQQIELAGFPLRVLDADANLHQASADAICDRPGDTMLFLQR